MITLMAGRRGFDSVAHVVVLILLLLQHRGRIRHLVVPSLDGGTRPIGGWAGRDEGKEFPSYTNLFEYQFVRTQKQHSFAFRFAK